MPVEGLRPNHGHIETFLTYTWFRSLYFRVAMRKPAVGASGFDPLRKIYAALRPCCALTLAHLALCAAAILRRAATESIRLAGALPADFTAEPDAPRVRAHRAFCAWAMRLRANAETTRFGRTPLLPPADPLAPDKSSRTEIAESNFSNCNCACWRSSRSCWSAILKLDIGPPVELTHS
jgi:hypothetical protein